MGLGDPPQPSIGEDQKKDHGQDHDQALEGIGVHHRLNPAGDHLGRGDQGKDQECDCKIQPKLGYSKDAAPSHHCGGIQRHQ